MWRASKEELIKCGFAAKEAAEMIEAKEKINPQSQLEKFEKLSIKVIGVDDENYPLRLREIHSPPPFLFVVGEIKSSDSLGLGVVGTRLLSDYGKRVTKEFSRDIARAGITIISGLALGADTLAHQAAVVEGGRTIGVIGSGLDNIYPVENKKLAREIINKNLGAVISELPLGSLPERQNFPRRNRIISGLSKGILVTEAPQRSGALITAQMALDQNRDVFAIPSGIFSKKSLGTNHLIRDLNAKLVTSASDIVSDFGLGKREKQVLPEDMKGNLATEELQILKILSSDSSHIDDIVRRSEKDPAHVSSVLSMLEIKGFVQNLGAMMWSRN